MSQYLLPAEWHPQQAILLTWPHAHSDWVDILDEVEPCYLQIAKVICQHQQLIVACYDQSVKTHINALLQAENIDADRYSLYLVKSNDTWARDHGPIAVINDHSIQLLDFNFNGWGNKYDSILDNQISQNLAQQGAFNHHPLCSRDFVLEGGSIECNGIDTLLTTRSCLLSNARNPQFNQDEIESYLCRQFGLKRVLWLQHGALDGDDTDSHIDTLARFAPNDTILYMQGDQSGDKQDQSLNRMEQEIKAFRAMDDKPYRLIPLPSPQPVYNSDGDRLPATYANFLIINGVVLVPTYHDPSDQIAMAQIQQAFPHHQMIPIDASPLIQQFGSIHCISMQIPAIDG
jgi:agmatine/peptidylarginine deiminase